MSRQNVRELASASLACGDAAGWLETLYARANFDPSHIPWAEQRPNPHLLDWLTIEGLDGAGQRALVVGCGLGDDAVALDGLGFDVTAFDVAATAVAWCRERFPDHAVDWQHADALSPPVAWTQAFAFVFEAYTLQVLPPEPRRAAIASIARCVAPAGQLLVVCRGRDPEDAPGELPWPLTRSELDAFEAEGLRLEGVEDIVDPYEMVPVRRFLASYRRPVSG